MFATRSWFLFNSEGSNRPGEHWDHLYSLEFYAKDELWVVTYADTDPQAGKVGPRQVAAWCKAPNCTVVETATALLLAWRDACLKFGGPGVEFYNLYGDLKLPYEQFRMLCSPPWQSLERIASGARRLTGTIRNPSQRKRRFGSHL